MLGVSPRIPRYRCPECSEPAHLQTPAQDKRGSPVPASLRHRVNQAEALAQTGDARRVHLEGVALAELGEGREIGLARGIDLGEPAEEVLETCRRDDLDDLAWCVAGVPESVPLVARLEHPRADACRDYVVAEKCAERSRQYVRVLVLARMPVQRRGESARRERVMHDGEPLARLGSLDLPDDAEPGEIDSFASVHRNRDSVELRAHGALR